MKRTSVVASAFGIVAFLWYGSEPGWDLFRGFPLLAIGGVALLTSAVTAAIALAGWRRSAPLARLTVGLFAAVIASALLIRTTIPLGLRIAVSEPWLRSRAHALIRTQSKDSEAHWVGLFNVRSGGVGNMAVFDAGPSGLFGDAGIAFVPNGPPPSDRGEYSHVYGPWWRYESHDD